MATIVRKETLLNVSTSPHVRSSLSTRRVMLDVIISLLPAAVLGVVNLGVPALMVIAASIAAAVASEVVCRWGLRNIRKFRLRIRSCL